MVQFVSLSRAAAGAALALVLLTGCGGGNKPVAVTGKLVVPSKVKLSETDSIQVTFTPEDAGKASGGVGTVSPKDLTFTVNVPPGTYKVAVTFQAYPGEKESEKRQKDFSQHVGMFETGATALRYEVKNEANQSVTIDLTKSSISSP